ncbi:hypothetical protein ACFQ0B_15925 [Nonomuraea thailandensis]
MIREAVAATWGVEGAGERLHGGEESAACRLHGHVLRIGPEGRAVDEQEWCHTIARHAAATLPEALAPLPTPEGTTVVVVAGRPISCWPYVEPTWPDSGLPAQRAPIIRRPRPGAVPARASRGR